MGVTTWLVILTCFCVLQGSLGSVHKRSYSPTISKMLRRLAKKQLAPTPTPSPTVWTPPPSTPYPTNNPADPNTINFYQHWAECPVLESLLEQYFWDFPHTAFPKDSMNIDPAEMRRVLTRAVSAFDYLKNVRVSVDLLMEDTARLILDQRVNCTTAMYQRVFVYYMRRRLDEMMSPRDTSLKSRIEVVLKQYFPNSPDILSWAGQFVWGVHYIVHESFIDMLKEEMFQSLDWFLRDYKWTIPSFLERFHRGEFATINDVTSQMVNDFSIVSANYPDAFRCTSPQEFIHMHVRIANQTQRYYWQAHNSGLAVTFLTSHLQEMFDMTHSPSLVNVDPLVVDEAIQKIVNIMLGYVNDTMVELATYERYLASSTLSPPTFMASSLSDVQWNMTMMLFNRMFHNGPFPPTQNPIGTVSPGPGLGPREMAMYLQRDVDRLNRIKSLMPNSWTSDPEYATIQNEVNDMINAKETLIRSLPLAYTPVK